MQFFLRVKNQKWIRVTALVLVTAMVSLVSFSGERGIMSSKLSVYADTKSDWEDAKEDLADAVSELEDLEAQAEQTAEDLEKASKVLDKLLAVQAELEDKISDCQDLIDQNNKDLEAAQAKVDEEYESMKLRIQFMYENSSDDTIWAAIVSADNFSDVLNRLEYISQVHEADRKLMDNYETALKEVERIGDELASNLEDLLAMQSDYQDQQSAVKSTIAMLEQERDTYASQIADAEDLKSDYEDTVSELAAKMRAEEAAAANADPDSYEGGGSGGGGLGDAGYLTDDSNDPENQTSVTGEELVAYALQFVGAHYVWAGNTICYDWTDNIGIDCSGFVHMVYSHFGISTPRYSQSFKSVGQPVSYNNIQPGDVVVYPGHVAICIGNGCIVEAQGSKAGVTSNRPVDCHTITAIRRLI